MRYLLSILLALWAGAAAADGLVIAPAAAPPGGCDDCSGALVVSFHFEDTTGNDLTQGTPCGCYDAGGNATYSLTGGSSYDATYYSDGATGVNAQGEDDAVEYSVGTLDFTETGTWCGDVYYTGTSNARVFALTSTGASIYGDVTYNAGGNVAKMTFGGDYKQATTTFSNNTWTRLCFSWDESQGAGADKLAVKVGAAAWAANEEATLTDATQDATAFVISGNFQYARGYYDNVKIYSTYEAE